jgi:hypothetical protein
MNTVFTYRLKNDLILPATGYPSAGYLFFPKNEFGLTYEVYPRPKQKTMVVKLGIGRLETDDMVWELTNYEITEKGFPTSQYQNQSEIDVYNQTRQNLEQSINSLSLEISLKEDEIKTYIDSSLIVPQNLIDEYNSLKAERDNAITELSNLVSPEPIPIYINKYDDVIGYFKGDGSLTEEGVQWARSVYYNGILIGDLIE